MSGCPSGPRGYTQDVMALPRGFESHSRQSIPLTIRIGDATRTHISLSLNPFAANMGCVYMLTAPSVKKYIGITTRPIEERWKGHQKKSSNCLLVKRAIEKYGWDKIKKEILIYCQDDKLEYYEKTFIDLYDSFAPNGMNCTSGGEINKQLSQNTKTNISSGLQQFYRENEHRGKLKYMTQEDKMKANGCICKRKSHGRIYYTARTPRSWTCNGKQKHLGSFKTRELAQAAIEEWRSKLIQ